MQCGLKISHLSRLPSPPSTFPPSLSLLSLSLSLSLSPSPSFSLPAGLLKVPAKVILKWVWSTRSEYPFGFRMQGTMLMELNSSFPYQRISFLIPESAMSVTCHLLFPFSFPLIFFLFVSSSPPLLSPTYFHFPPFY